MIASLPAQTHQVFPALGRRHRRRGGRPADVRVGGEGQLPEGQAEELANPDQEAEVDRYLRHAAGNTVSFRSVSFCFVSLRFLPFRFLPGGVGWSLGEDYNDDFTKANGRLRLAALQHVFSGHPPPPSFSEC